MTEFTRAQVLERIAGVELETQKKMVCALVGHSRMHTNCFGYKYCARCGEQVGDSLGGAYSGKDTVIIGHDCDTCRENAKAFTWKDTLLAPNPFSESAVAP